MKSNHNSIENVNNKDHVAKDSGKSENEHSRDDLERQIHQMNEAILQLRDEHKSQMDNMKQFYDDQISKMRQEYNKNGPQPTQQPVQSTEIQNTESSCNQ